MGRQSKYDYAFRLRCVEAVLKQHCSIKSVARENGFNESNLRLWLGFYEAYGPMGLKQCRKQHYDTTFKLKVLKAIAKDALSLRAACVRFNIPNDSVIVQWRKNYNLNGFAGLAAKARGRPPKILMPPIKRKPRKSSKPLTREEELLLEIEALKAENELLKKLQALAQAKRKQKP